MYRVNLKLPESIQKRAREYAEKEGISVDRLAATALSEKLAALGAADYVQTRAKRASAKKFRAALAAVPNVRPVEGDE